MSNVSTYNTVNQTTEAIYKDKGSKFIAHLFPITRLDEFKIGLQDIKKQHPSAGHFCFAYRIGPRGEEHKSSDDGEPSGTAGKPILNQLLSAQISNCALVVLRYFGGTKLGVSGLIKAYKSAAKAVIEESSIVEKRIYKTVHLQFDYLLMNDVMRIVKEESIEIIEQKNNVHCEYVCDIWIPNFESAHAKLSTLNGLILSPKNFTK